MVEISKDTISREQLIEMTKKLPGIRYKTDKNGDFHAYGTGWTFIVDIVKMFYNWLAKIFKLYVKRT